MHVWRKAMNIMGSEYESKYCPAFQHSSCGDVVVMQQLFPSQEYSVFLTWPVKNGNYVISWRCLLVSDPGNQNTLFIVSQCLFRQLPQYLSSSVVCLHCMQLPAAKDILGLKVAVVIVSNFCAEDHCYLFPVKMHYSLWLERILNPHYHKCLQNNTHSWD